MVFCSVPMNTLLTNCFASFFAARGYTVMFLSKMFRRQSAAFTTNCSTSLSICKPRFIQVSLCTLLISNSGHQHSRQRDLATVEALLVKYVRRIFYFSCTCPYCSSQMMGWVVYGSSSKKSTSQEGNFVARGWRKTFTCFWFLHSLHSFKGTILCNNLCLLSYFRHAGVCLVLSLL